MYRILSHVSRMITISVSVTKMLVQNALGMIQHWINVMGDAAPVVNVSMGTWTIEEILSVYALDVTMEVFVSIIPSCSVSL